MITMKAGRADRRAMMALVIVAVGFVGGLIAFSEFPKGDDVEADRLTAGVDSTMRGGHNVRQTISDKKQPAVDAVSTFDPNTVDSTTLLQLGLTSRQAHGWLRYRESGAVFRTAMDITRLYVLTDDDIDHLLPKVRIAERFANRRSKYPVAEHRNDGPNETKPADVKPERLARTYPEKFTELTTINVNTADTTLLKRIPGIGSNIARWIVERRERLGGFHSVEQLMEVKNVNESLLKWFDVNPLEHNMINISDMTFSDMLRFPYIGYDKAKAISNYIRTYGKFKKAEDLIASNIFTEEELKKLLPYCRFQ